MEVGLLGVLDLLKKAGVGAHLESHMVHQFVTKSSVLVPNTNPIMRTDFEKKENKVLFLC